MFTVGRLETIDSSEDLHVDSFDEAVEAATKLEGYTIGIWNGVWGKPGDELVAIVYSGRVFVDGALVESGRVLK